MLTVFFFLQGFPQKEAEAKIEAEEMPVPFRVPPPVIPAPAAAPEEDKEDIEELISSLTITESRPMLFFDDLNIVVAYPKGFYANGRKRLIFDILCQAQHRNYYRVVMGLSGTSFCLQACISWPSLTSWGRSRTSLTSITPTPWSSLLQ